MYIIYETIWFAFCGYFVRVAN